MIRVARTLPPLRAVVALLAALALLTVPAAPAAAHHVAAFSDTRGDANGVNDQLEGLCCDVSTPAASLSEADIVGTSVRTLYRNSKPVATQLRITMAAAIKGGGRGYELRVRSARCGNISGLFTTNKGWITEGCDTSKIPIRHAVAVHNRGRTLFVRIPYNLNRAAGLLRPGDRLSRFQTNSNFGTGPFPLPRLDWANARPEMTFNVGQ